MAASSEPSAMEPATVEEETAVGLVPEAQAPGSVTVYDGARMYLRSFPVWYRWRQVPDTLWSPKRPESGVVDGVAFEQTMGRMVLYYQLGHADVGITEDDVLVEMSCWEMRVTINGRKVPELSRELFADIRRRFSWWRLESDETGAGRRLVIFLAKLEHRAWRGPWFTDAMNIHRKQTFGWGPKHLSQQLLKALKSNDENLSRVPPGEPQDFGKSLCVAIPPERLCTGVDDDEEDARHIYVNVHLDEETLELASTRVPLEELFSADVEANYLEVRLRGDSFGVCWGPLHALCVPELTTWEIRSIRRKNLPANSGIKCPAFYNPALRIKLTKAEGYQHLWGHAFEEMQRPQFELPRERISWTDRVQRALVLSPAAPLSASAKAERAQQLCTRIECREDLLLNRAIVILHLEDRLEGLAEKFGVDLGSFFSLKVSDRVLEVNAVADSEFTMVMGGLGGACVPERTSWEIVREKSSPTEEQDHLALKVTLSKAPGHRDRWVDVFTRWEPWQVTEHLIQDMAAKAAALSDQAAKQGQAPDEEGDEAD